MRVSMIESDDRSHSDTVPRCVCSWKNCRLYQECFQELKHPVFDGTIKLKFVKDHPASQPLKDCVDRVLRVPSARAEDWKPRKKDEQLVARYHIARHHYTKKHIQKYLTDPKGFSFFKPFSIQGAKKYLFTVDPNETFQAEDSNETVYLQAPNVPDEVVKAELMQLKKTYEASENGDSSSNNSQYHHNDTSNNSHYHHNDTSNSKAEVNTSKGKTVQPSSTSPKPLSPRNKDSKTTRLHQQLEKEVESKELENKRLKDELDEMKSQLAFLSHTVRKSEGEKFDSNKHTDAFPEDASPKDTIPVNPCQGTLVYRDFPVTMVAAEVTNNTPNKEDKDMSRLMLSMSEQRAKDLEAQLQHQRDISLVQATKQEPSSPNSMMFHQHSAAGGGCCPMGCIICLLVLFTILGVLGVLLGIFVFFGPFLLIVGIVFLILSCVMCCVLCCLNNQHEVTVSSFISGGGGGNSGNAPMTVQRPQNKNVVLMVILLIVLVGAICGGLGAVAYFVDPFKWFDEKCDLTEEICCSDSDCQLFSTFYTVKQVCTDRVCVDES